MRSKVTEECKKYWEKRIPEDIKSINALFEGLDDDELNNLFQLISKLEGISANLYREAKDRKISP